MTFCWTTSFIGYPNFLKSEGRSQELAAAFVTLAKASLRHTTYQQAKGLFPELDHAQVETKKAAFQEYGLLYVVPRSNQLTLTPLGHQILGLIGEGRDPEPNRRDILLAVARALCRYQFDNPLPVGGNRWLERAQSTDVLPYLAAYYLMHRLDGVLTVTELRGLVFGLQRMADLRRAEREIRNHRKRAASFRDIPGLPANARTADNLKIYFMSHLGLDSELTRSTTATFYGTEEQAFELTEAGYELVGLILDEAWPTWRRSTGQPPKAKAYESVVDYFSNGIGQACPGSLIARERRVSGSADAKLSAGLIDRYDLEQLKELPHREFKEGRKRLINHMKMEHVRSAALISHAKRAFKANHGHLFCEICGFDFERTYRERGADYIEAHHRIPIAELKDTTTLTAEDLLMVCSNCHRMLHRPPWTTADDIRVKMPPAQSG